MADQKPNDDQGIDMGQWEETGLKPFTSSPVRFSLPNRELEPSCIELPHRKIFPDSNFFESDTHYQIYTFKPETNSIPKELMKNSLKL